jgi:cytoskeletal protein CcmA (bactofilin family)
MFKRKKSSKKNSSNSNNIRNTTQGPSITYITESTEITANLYCEDDVRIAGSLQGEIESKKKVMLAETGIIKGSIHSQKADIYGKVTGDLNIVETLILRSTAVVDGSISTKKLTIEKGAQVKGSFQVGPDVQVSSNGKEKSSEKK